MPPQGHKKVHQTPTGKTKTNTLPMTLIQTNNLTRKPIIRHNVKMANKVAIHGMENHFAPTTRAVENILTGSFLALQTTREQPAAH